ncbi:hypothetical protein [Trabulsiella odontotermitis]|uniref:hypothetical protein n=1 Tax=Trabulsiella odontotermitis TaxID=379893 RepID=UPI000AB042F3|nr:hypothetical protein [Trabulsiella odontotermitis]
MAVKIITTVECRDDEINFHIDVEGVESSHDDEKAVSKYLIRRLVSDMKDFKEKLEESA